MQIIYKNIRKPMKQKYIECIFCGVVVCDAKRVC